MSAMALESSPVAAASNILRHHFVLPGQILATSHSESDGGFLRGHGTYIELVAEDSDDDESDDDGCGNRRSGRNRNASSGWGSNRNDAAAAAIEEERPAGDEGAGADNDDDAAAQQPTKGPQRLVASIAGTVERVNKLISVVPVAPSAHAGQVGDLIVGRIVGVGGSRWRVSLSCSSGGGGAARDAQLPLSGVNLPGGVQRIRTSEDVLAMRELYREGDLLTSEVQSVQHDGTLVLHTRSLRYGKLENGICIVVPPSLVGRRKNHFVTLKGLWTGARVTTGDDEEEGGGEVDVYLGLNGAVWIQRTVPPSWENAVRSEQDERAPLAETLQKLRHRHAATSVSKVMRERLARVRNSIECLRLVHCMVSPESIAEVVKASMYTQGGVSVADMLLPENVVKLTDGTRNTGM